MAVGEGKFVLYSRISPPLHAGDYQLTARQDLGASTSTGALGPDELPVQQLETHFRVRSPRFALPPDQALSTFPPANAEGSFGSRLPQIVIKRRTLPWERDVGPGGVETTPWLALVVIAEGEAELKLNQPIAQCATPGVHFDGVAEAELGSYLQVRKSIVDKVFPTRLDVPLLAHAREVDIHDTELMMGDDDGFLAVVIANRLPLPGRDADGNEVPVKYLACLINLEQQFQVLRERAPDPSPFTVHPQVVLNSNLFTLPDWDRISMGMPAFPGMDLVAGGAGLGVHAAAARPAAARPAASVTAAAPGPTAMASAPAAASRTAAAAPYEAGGAWASKAAAGRSTGDVYADMARPFERAYAGILGGGDPTYRFPVLLHWSFTSAGQTTFRNLMEGADLGLLGTTSTEPPPAGRPAPEVVETGHVGLGHKTRRGDDVRIWYRGPFVPHPTVDPPGGRLPLAHASDQLRIVVPDGREDLSLAAAFEVGRLLALSRPSLIASLLRWRQLHYQAARREAIWRLQADFLEAMAIDLERIGRDVGGLLGRGLAKVIAAQPMDFLGNPRPLATPGRALAISGDPLRALTTGLGIAASALVGQPGEVLSRLASTAVPKAPAPNVTALGGMSSATGVLATSRAVLKGMQDLQINRLALDAIPGLGTVAVGAVGSARKPAARKPDALDKLIDSLGKQEEQE
ncbi:MAG TPA: hypothetical protein VFA20_10205 [Myxococcaceae bacterium]|nr:hypothetical protein [Myxococcaceae bacterium]